MKYRFPLVYVTALALSPVLEASSLPVTFKAQNALVESDKVLFPDTAKTYEFKMVGNQGLTLGGKPTVGADEKSLVFSGQQNAAFCTTEPFPRPRSSIKVEMSLFLNPDAALSKNNGTVLKHANWEIRTDAQRNQLIVVLWHKSKLPYSQMAVPIKLGVWQRILVKFDSGVFVVDVDGSSQQMPITEKLHYPKHVYSNLILGANAPEMGNLDLEAFRPFCGALADLTIALDVP